MTAFRVAAWCIHRVYDALDLYRDCKDAFRAGMRGD